MAIALSLALVILLGLLHLAREELKSQPPRNSLRGFRTIVLILPPVVTVALIVFVLAIAGDLVVERIAHGLLILAGCEAVSVQIFTVLTLRQSDRKPRTVMQVGQFLPVPFIIYLTPIQNSLRFFGTDNAAAFALIGSLAMILYGYTALVTPKPRHAV